MNKLLFLPLRVSAGMLAAVAARKLFDRTWALVDAEKPPTPEQRLVPASKLVPALVIEGALLGLLKGLADHGSRSAFARLTGSWPGDEPPRPQQD